MEWLRSSPCHNGDPTRCGPWKLKDSNCNEVEVKCRKCNDILHRYHKSLFNQMHGEMYELSFKKRKKVNRVESI